MDYNALTFAVELVFLSSAYAVAICSDACRQKSTSISLAIASLH